MTPVPAVGPFLEAFSEFNKAPLVLVEAKLVQAARRTNAEVYADDATAIDACYLRAAILLTKSPHARKLRLVDDEQAFVWASELFELQRGATQGMRVF